MNWLAHVFLSEPNVEFRLGNLLADIVKGEQRKTMPPTFLRGVQQHHTIDSFTDAHPVVRRSRNRISTAQRRFSGVIVDVFYDYFLASGWNAYARMPMDAFTSNFYAEAQAHSIDLPGPAQTTIDRIIQYDLLGSYREVAGVERSLRRISMGLAARWPRTFSLEDGVSDLLAQHDAFESDFAEFFPELQARVGLQTPRA